MTDGAGTPAGRPGWAATAATASATIEAGDGAGSSGAGAPTDPAATIGGVCDDGADSTAGAVRSNSAAITAAWTALTAMSRRLRRVKTMSSHT